MDKIAKQVIKLAYQEDIGKGDITTDSIIPKSQKGKALIVAKSDGILSGIEAVKYAFKLASPKIEIVFHIGDGKKFASGIIIASIKGPAHGILKGERLALNLLSHLSGVASLTAKFVEQVKGTQADILDTRKTTPGLRSLEKQAVLHGGGKNHRMGLYDMVLIKDNHIASAGSVNKALEKFINAKCKVEIEISDFEQLESALQYSPDIIMLDNFNTRQLARAVWIIKSKKPKIKIEVSGGVTLKNIKAKAKTGIDYISIGALTHTVSAIDFSMRNTA
ncbi:MAG: carboxylating nicotinate-nucleotide diphosphorylase [candidate division Zixibacteria bacterium]|nr:carboxylating nicotinate-nucleotide diphosphorylase [candidate division Zixibacteria bacterium]